MGKEQKISLLLFSIIVCVLGFLIGCVFNEYMVDNYGIPTTSYCKEIQIDTLQYNCQQDMYKFKIKIIQ